MNTELLPYVKNEIAPIIQPPPIPVFDDHIDKFLELTKEFKCESSEDFEQAKTWGQMGVRLNEDMWAAFAPYFDFLAQLKDPIVERRARYVAKVKERMNLIDSAAIEWKRQQDKILELEDERRHQEELQRRIAEREELLREAELKKQIADEFGMETVVEVELPPVVEPRRSAIESPHTYRKGKRVKAKLVATIVNPDKVKREFCEPDKTLINLKVANYAKQVIKPTAEQIAKLAEEIGGVEIKWE